MKGFTDWINTHQKDASENELKHLWKASASYKVGYAPNVDKGHDRFMESIRAGQKPSAAIVPINRGFKVWRVAAMIAFLVVAGMLFKHFTGSPTGLDQIVTAPFELKNMNLEDGTVVSLNGTSNLEFPAHFDNEERMVKLTGEAFFEVAKDESKPFKVETGKAVVEVLGTSFNVRSFPNENFLEVFVKTGSVAVKVLGQNENYVLSPGDLMHFDFETNDVEKIIGASAENSIAWKSGKLTFKNQPMSEIFKALSRHYHVKFDLKSPALKNCPYTINFATDKLADVLEGFEEACNLTFTKKENSLYEVNGSCCE